jgi:hypothetical protein
LEPGQVELQSRAKGASKRRPNLNYHELEAIAENFKIDVALIAQGRFSEGR